MDRTTTGPRPGAEGPTDVRRRAGRRTAAITGIVAGLAAATLVLAGLTATTSNPLPQDVSGGELALELSDVGVGFSQDVIDLAPGDVVRRHVRLDSTGSLDGTDVTLGIDAAGAATLIGDGASTRALTVAVRGCSVAWDAAAGTCTGTVTSLLAATMLGSLADPVTLAPALAAGGSLHLQIELVLPDQDETTVDGAPPAVTIQGQSVALTYTFTMVQRDPVTTTS